MRIEARGERLPLVMRAIVYRALDSQADAKSVLAVMQLGASSGQQVTVRAVGPDAEKAVETLIGILSAVSRVGD